MLTKEQISKITTKVYGASNALVTSSGDAIIIDSDLVLPNHHWIILAASAVIRDQSNYVNLAVGGQYTGIFMCPPGTPKPSNYLGFNHAPLKAPLADPYSFNKNQYSYYGNETQPSATPTFVPINGSSYDGNSTPGTPWDEIVLQQPGPFFIGANWFVRAAFAKATTAIAFGGVPRYVQFILQVIDEPNC